MIHNIKVEIHGTMKPQSTTKSSLGSLGRSPEEYI